MKKTIKTPMILLAITIISLGLMAFSPFGGDSDNDGINDYDAALAEALGISVEELQTAKETAHEAAIAQAVEDGTITQEQADAMADGGDKGRGGKGGRHVPGSNYNALLAEALGITTEEIETAQQSVRETLVSERPDNSGTREARSSIQTYLEDAVEQANLNELYQQAYQDAVEAALADEAITEDQAALLLENLPSFGHGFGGHGGRP